MLNTLVPAHNLRLNHYEELTMAEEKLNEAVPLNQKADDYTAPAIEDVVTREGLEREAAYAGAPAPSNILA
jgi:hypothetical protein